MVVAVIGILVALLLPAVNAAREASRITQCAHNLKQIGLAVTTHASVHGHLPAGGWGWRWVGEPERGFGAAQPGGWIYNTLPYLEQQAIHDLGSGSSGAERRAAFAQRAQVPLPMFYCPSRRSGLMACDTRRGQEPYNQNAVEFVARTDYAGNMGDKAPAFGFPTGPKTYVFTDEHATALHRSYANDPSYRPFYVEATGVLFLIRYVRPRDIIDGMSTTYLAGEKYLDPNDYESGREPGDNQNLYIGNDQDNCRFTTGTVALWRDRRGVDNNFVFGSCHQSGVNMVLCDGSVHLVSYNVDLTVHKRFGNRQDQQAASSEQLH